jgi:photosystem II stability/assembly factor-like uncharacterized protein
VGGALARKKKSETDTMTAEVAKSGNRELRDSAAYRTALAHSAPPLIVAPNLAAMWRLGVAGAIEYSSDQGTTWKSQQSFVTADLTAGSAPSGTICWVVGVHGTVLLTTDSGETWKKVPAPLVENLSGVHATDALRATVWAAFNRGTFETTDGGTTWKQIANE